MTREEIRQNEERCYRLQCMAYDYYGNNPRRNKFVTLISLLGARRLHPDCFKHPRTTWKECWDYAFK